MQARFGPLAGRDPGVGAEEQGLVHSIGTDGSVASYGFGVAVEDIDLVEPNQSFFGVNFGSGRLLAASPSNFASMTGDLLLTQGAHSGSGLFHLAWDGAAFQVTPLAVAPTSEVPSAWEHVTFARWGSSPSLECEVSPGHPLDAGWSSRQLPGHGSRPLTRGQRDPDGGRLPLERASLLSCQPAATRCQGGCGLDPVPSQVGGHVIVFRVTDSSGLVTECPVTIDVQAQPCITLNFDSAGRLRHASVNGSTSTRSSACW
jgi:hypothetical protein